MQRSAQNDTNSGEVVSVTSVSRSVHSVCLCIGKEERARLLQPVDPLLSWRFQEQLSPPDQFVAKMRK